MDLAPIRERLEAIDHYKGPTVGRTTYRNDVGALLREVERHKALIEYIASAMECNICLYDHERSRGLCSQHQYPPLVAQRYLDGWENGEPPKE